MDAVRGIGFDLDHTLAIDNRLERVAFLRLLEALLSEGGRTVGMLSDEIESIDDLLTHQRRGEFSIDEAVRRFVAAHAVKPTQQHVDRYRGTAVEMVEEFLVPLPGVRPTLEALIERGIAVAILSNGWNPLQQRKAERAGFHGAVLVSSEIGEQKPARRAFDLLLAALGSSPEQTWYVGDSPQSDVAGANSAGMGSVWLNWEHQTYPSDLQTPTHTIHNLGDLLELLPSPVRTG